MIGRLLFPSLYLSITGLLISCSTMSEVQPDDYLNRAKELIQSQQYQLAKQYVDSVKIRFPKEFSKIREGLSIMRDINFAEQKRTLAFCDSMLKVRQTQLPEAQKPFAFEKNEEYESIGHYVYKSQVQDDNLGRTFLQTKVDEKGHLVLTSYYSGSRTLHHTGLRVSAPDGSFVESLVVPQDGALNYSFNDDGVRYEIVRFNEKAENGIIDFVLLHEKEPINISLTGGAAKAYHLSANDKKAMQASSELSVILSDITRLLDEIRLAQAKMEYIYRKQSRSNVQLSDSGNP
jgi:hypothetical protein